MTQVMFMTKKSQTSIVGFFMEGKKQRTSMVGGEQCCSENAAGEAANRRQTIKLWRIFVFVSRK